MPALDPAAMRRFNASLTLRTLAETEGRVTMARLVERTSLSRRTTELILADLAAEGWVTESTPEPGTTGVGRPPRIFEFRPENALLVAAHIDTHSATAIVTDVRGTILGRARRVLRDYADPRASAEDAASAVDAALLDSGLARERVRAGGLATSGAVGADGAMFDQVHQPAWTGFDLAGELRLRTGIPFRADNDTNLAALAERWHGVGRDHDTFAWLVVGRRAGVGLIIHGDVHRGSNGAAGEIVNVPGFDISGMEQHPVGQLSSQVPEERQGALELVALAGSGNRKALALIDGFVEPLARMLATLAWTLAPPLFVFGGGIEAAADVLHERLRPVLARYRTPEFEVRFTSLGDDGPLLGAVKLARDEVDEQIFGPAVLP